MARYYRRRYTRVVKPKKKWASNIGQVTFPAPTSTNATYGYAQVICANSAQSAIPIPTIVKSGNFKVQMDVTFESNEVGNMITAMAYLIYVPEGTGPSFANPQTPTTSEYFNWITAIAAKHPEWLLACKMIGSNWSTDVHNNYDRIQFSSRLKRNLNSGDAVYLCVTGEATRQGERAGKVQNVQGHALVQWWTCTN